MILGNDQGAVVTRNGGETWSSWYNQRTGQFYHVATDNRFPYWVYGAQQDSGAAATPSRSKYRSLNFHDWRPMEAGDENGYIAPDPLNPEVVYGGTVARQNLSNEQVSQMPVGLAQTEKLRSTWTLPLVFSPTDAHVLYFGSQKLFRTADGGNSWGAISPDLTREDPSVPANLDAATAADAPAEKRRGVIYTIGPSSVKVGEIWTGTDDGQIQLTQDEGKTWSDVTPPEITAWSKVTHIESSHFEAGTAYAAIDRHRLEDLTAYLYRTRDFGKSWTRISRGIPGGNFLNCVREDRVRKGLLYACTEKGVYISFNNGDDWQSLQLNLPTTSVRDLVIHENDLVIATFGRSFWILDDVTPLRQIDSQLESSDAWLFAPQTTYRVGPGYDQGTPVPMDEPLSENPPDGAVLDFYLKEKSSSPVQLEIFDSGGKLVRRFASDDKLFRTNADSVPLTMNWIRDPQPLPNETGMHRFIWDLHYALPEGVQRSYFFSAGPWVVPGNYSVQLTANGKSTTQPLTIKMDPRSNDTADLLQRQFAVATQLSQTLGQVSIALQQAKDLRKQINERKKDAAGKSELLAALDDFNRKMEVSVELDTDNDFMIFGLALPDKSHESLPHAQSALTGLLMVEQSADVAPSADIVTAANAWEASSKDSLARWKTILERDFAPLNSKLQKANLKPLALH